MFKNSETSIEDINVLEQINAPHWTCILTR